MLSKYRTRWAVHVSASTCEVVMDRTPRCGRGMDGGVDLDVDVVVDGGRGCGLPR
ncbi:MAG: hypothetical protein FWD57_02185 [Polyangiaceae bacterium]|nr:hypothetical protein [Polyangiaceae bacterium]